MASIKVTDATRDAVNKAGYRLSAMYGRRVTAEATINAALRALESASNPANETVTVNSR